MRRSSLIFVTINLVGVVSASSGYKYRNVFGDSLPSCSSSSMALTGYTRTGLCVDRNDDAGSHHICIDLSSAQGGNFCDVTGQDDWCSSEMPCHDDSSQNCPVQNWCVCQWAFASYLENAGGCDQIQDIVCDAVNLQALKGYWSHKSTPKYQTALDCIIERCGVTNQLYKGRNQSKWLLLSVGSLLVAAFAIVYNWRKNQEANVAPSFKQSFVEKLT